MREVFTKKNGYPASFVDRALNKKRRPNELPTPDKPIGTITVIYIKGVSQCIGRILGRADIRTTSRTVTTIRSLLVKTKPVTEEHKKKGVIYKVPCQDCNKVYIGETGRRFGTRLNEHKRHCKLLQPDKSTIAEHAIGENHHIDFDQSEVVTTEDRFWPGKVTEEALHFNFNQDTGLALSDIWNPYTRHIHIH